MASRIINKGNKKKQAARAAGFGGDFLRKRKPDKADNDDSE